MDISHIYQSYQLMSSCLECIELFGIISANSGYGHYDYLL